MTRGIPTGASDVMFGRPDGELFLPANGTEGEIFEGCWCQRCSKDQFDAGGDSCTILLNALCGEQPEEWRYQDGVPVCTAFEANGNSGGNS
ncbi:MAG: hypothetical protein AAGI44_05895 [Pseudomonadota bacterium]